MADFREAKIEDSNFEGSNFREAIFQDYDLHFLKQKEVYDA